jgi:DNA-directed RNA polymerase subunit RPC12/RpoP
MAGAFTQFIGISEENCGLCEQNKMIYQKEVSADGIAEMLVVKCPKCGPIKRLFNERPSPIFRRLYAEFFTGELKDPPKIRREI